MLSIPCQTTSILKSLDQVRKASLDISAGAVQHLSLAMEKNLWRERVNVILHDMATDLK